MTFFTQRTSIHGRRIGLSSSGGICSSPSGSTDIDRAAQMWGPGMTETVSAAGAAISNFGVTVLSTDSTSGTAPFLVGAPVIGAEKEIYLQTSATLMHLNTTATTIFFNTTSAIAAAGGSTVLIAANAAAAGLGGEALALRGLSATVWQVRSMTAGWSS